MCGSADMTDMSIHLNVVVKHHPKALTRGRRKNNFLTYFKINDAINKLKKDRSPGRGNITGELIQYSHPKLSVYATVQLDD